MGLAYNEAFLGIRPLGWPYVGLALWNRYAEANPGGRGMYYNVLYYNEGPHKNPQYIFLLFSKACIFWLSAQKWTIVGLWRSRKNDTGILHYVCVFEGSLGYGHPWFAWLPSPTVSVGSLATIWTLSLSSVWERPSKAQ